MPDTGTEPGNPGTAAVTPTPNVRTPPWMLACMQKHFILMRPIWWQYCHHLARLDNAPAIAGATQYSGIHREVTNNIADMNFTPASSSMPIVLPSTSNSIISWCNNVLQTWNKRQINFFMNCMRFMAKCLD
jgi:hypothetical protein